MWLGSKAVSEVLHPRQYRRKVREVASPSQASLNTKSPLAPAAAPARAAIAAAVLPSRRCSAPARRSRHSRPPVTAQFAMRAAAGSASAGAASTSAASSRPGAAPGPGTGFGWPHPRRTRPSSAARGLDPRRHYKSDLQTTIPAYNKYRWAAAFGH